MARHGKAEMVEDIVDDDPGKGAPPAVATFAPAAPALPAADLYPHGFLVKHPSFGALRVRQGEARTEAEALEVYRKTKCPHLTREMLERSGLRTSALAFVPAATERGK